MKHLCSCFALALGFPLGALGAQEKPALVAGARVRVTAPKHICTSPETWPCYRTVVGTLASIDSATIVVRLENGETVNVSRAPSTRLDVSTGRGACGGRCIGLGFLGGAAVGALAGVVYMFSHQSNCEIPCGLLYGFTAAGAVVGTSVGAVVGGREHWKSTPIPARLSVGPDGSGRFALGLSVGF